MVDYTNKYNTALGADEPKFRDWLRKQSGLHHSLSDYDLRGWWKKHNGADIGTKAPDEFKKPNHPTFSTASRHHGVDGHHGGRWSKMPNSDWSFSPGASNLEHFSPAKLRSYFRDVQPGMHLDLDDDRKQDQSLLAAIEKLREAVVASAVKDMDVSIDVGAVVKAIDGLGGKIDTLTAKIDTLVKVASISKASRRRFKLLRQSDGSLVASTEDEAPQRTN